MLTFTKKENNMFNLKMDIKNNYALFQDNDKFVMIESFDNKMFEVRLGNFQLFEKVAEINATTTEELNEKLEVLAQTL